MGVGGAMDVKCRLWTHPGMILFPKTSLEFSVPIEGKQALISQHIKAAAVKAKH